MKIKFFNVLLGLVFSFLTHAQTETVPVGQIVSVSVTANVYPNLEITGTINSDLNLNISNFQNATDSVFMIFEDATVSPKRGLIYYVSAITPGIGNSGTFNLVATYGTPDVFTLNGVGGISQKKAGFSPAIFLIDGNSSNSLKAVIQNHNDLMLQKKTDLYVNVKDFGAKGDSLINDSEAIKNAKNYAVSIGAKYIFFPVGKYSAPNLINTDLRQVIAIGEGEIVNSTYDVKVHPENNPNHSFFSNITANHLQRLHAKLDSAANGRATVAFWGNSLSGNAGISHFSSYPKLIEQKLIDTYGDVFDFCYRGIGGEAVNDVVDGADAYPPWYTDTTRSWAAYVNDCGADLIFVGFAMNDHGGQISKNYQATRDSILNFDTEADIVWFNTPVPTLDTTVSPDIWVKANREIKQDASAIIRNMSRSYGDGLLDFNRQYNIVERGEDIVRIAYKRSQIDSGQAVYNLVQRDLIGTEESRSGFELGFTLNTNVLNPNLDGLSNNFEIRTGNAETNNFSRMIHIANFSAGNQKVYYWDARNTAAAYFVDDITGKIPQDSVVRMHVVLKNNHVQIIMDGTVISESRGHFGLGSLFTPQIYLHNKVAATAAKEISGVIYNKGEPFKMTPQVTDEEVWGVGDGTTLTIKPPYGGNGLNHPSDLGLSSIYQPVVDMAQFGGKAGGTVTETVDISGKEDVANRRTSVRNLATSEDTKYVSEKGIRTAIRNIDTLNNVVINSNSNSVKVRNLNTNNTAPLMSVDANGSLFQSTRFWQANSSFGYRNSGKGVTIADGNFGTPFVINSDTAALTLRAVDALEAGAGQQSLLDSREYLTGAGIAKDVSWIVRRGSGGSWTDAILIQGVGVDGSALTPYGGFIFEGRDISLGRKFWGSQNNIGMIYQAGKLSLGSNLGVSGVSAPEETIDVNHGTIKLDAVQKDKTAGRVAVFDANNRVKFIEKDSVYTKIKGFFYYPENSTAQSFTANTPEAFDVQSGGVQVESNAFTSVGTGGQYSITYDLNYSTYARIDCYATLSHSDVSNKDVRVAINKNATPVNHTFVTVTLPLSSNKKNVHFSWEGVANVSDVFTPTLEVGTNTDIVVRDFKCSFSN